MKVLTAFLSITLVSVSGNIFAQDNQFKDIVYAEVNGRKLLLDLYVPAQKNPYLLVWVHGGAWRSGSKADPPMGLLPEGYALASVDYRLSTEAPFPALIHDIKASIRFLRTN